MSHVVSSPMVGNEFAMPRSRVPMAVRVPSAGHTSNVPIIPIQAVSRRAMIPVTVDTTALPVSPPRQLIELFHRHSIVVLALLFLVVGSFGVKVISNYKSAQIINSAKPALAIKPAVHTIAGLNLTVPREQLEAKLQLITGQPANIVVGGQTVAITPDTIKSWLQITASHDGSQNYLRIKADAINQSLASITNKFVKDPLNQVIVTRADGSSEVILAGRNGTKLTDPKGLETQTAAIAKTVMDGKGMQFSAPTETLAFASVTPAAFDKLIEVDVVTKQMYLYDHGQLSHSYAISAGAPSTPTPLGQYKVYQKIAVQDMRGFNADGSKYFQPHVRWISYFKSGGYAVHGNYWRPQSWFGVVNSSHGCVSLPDAQAKAVYDWTTVGTTVINHT